MAAAKPRRVRRALVPPGPITILIGWAPSPGPRVNHPTNARIDWFDLLAVQGTVKSLLQYHSSKASVLQLSVFFVVQLSHPYMTTLAEREERTGDVRLCMVCFGGDIFL